ncbi:MAG: hypothetical protein RLP12_11590, partial [Ekhidna sp.]
CAEVTVFCANALSRKRLKSTSIAILIFVDWEVEISIVVSIVIVYYYLDAHCLKKLHHTINTS